MKIRSFSSEREILYKILFDMKSDMNDLKKLVLDLIKTGECGYHLSMKTIPELSKISSEIPGARNMFETAAETHSADFSHHSRQQYPGYRGSS